MPSTFCKICHSVVFPDGSCPLCAAQQEVEHLLESYEEQVLGWMTKEEYNSDDLDWMDEEEIEQGLQTSFYSQADFRSDADFLEGLLLNDGAIKDCPCPICMGTPNLDPIFLEYEQEWLHRYDY